LFVSRKRTVVGLSSATFVGATALAAAGVGVLAHRAPVAGHFVGSAPPSGIRAAPFTLTSYRGSTVSMSAQRGKVVVLTFLDTDCVDQCPPIAHIVGRAMPRLTALERQHAVALAVSVNPRVDTSRNVHTFLHDTGAGASLNFLNGPVPALFRTWKAYHVLSALTSGNNNIHSADVMIFNPRGVWVSSLNQGVDLDPASLVHDIRAAMRDRRT
jgi:protein SCO1/2